MTQLLVSYSANDEPIVRPLLLRLDEHKSQLDAVSWRDVHRQIDRYEAKFKQALQETDVFVLFWSESASTSTYIQKEWSQVLDAGTCIVVFLLDATLLPSRLAGYQQVHDVAELVAALMSEEANEEEPGYADDEAGTYASPPPIPIENSSSEPLDYLTEEDWLPKTPTRESPRKGVGIIGGLFDALGRLMQPRSRRRKSSTGGAPVDNTRTHTGRGSGSVSMDMELAVGPAPAPPSPPSEGPVLFTAYYPRTATPAAKHSLLVYAHLKAFQEAVAADAEKFSDELGDGASRPRTDEAGQSIKPGTLITILPEGDGVEFDPPELTKKWDGQMDRFMFDLHIRENAVGEVHLFNISVRVEGFEIASITNCAVEVVESEPQPQVRSLLGNPLAEAKATSKSTTPYQKIFVSYAREDVAVAEKYKLAQAALGNEVFVDIHTLRAGADWRAELARAIDEAEVFQLFWSRHSSESEYCLYESAYAMDYRCPDTQCVGFIRPVYWENPMPEPPPKLSGLHFKYVPL